ncbi:MAG: hypothetical protein ACTHLW_16095 [Verrucomicrobiota bacterium]
MRKVIAEFETCRELAPDAYGDTGCQLSGLNHRAMVLRHERYTDTAHDSIYLFARQPEPGAQVFIEVFPGGEANPDWHERVRFYHEHRSDFRLPAGQKFDPSFLAPAASGFVRHEAFRTRDGRTRWRVVHAYAGTRRNILLVYSLDASDFLSSQFFAAVRDGLTLSDVPVSKPFRR